MSTVSEITPAEATTETLLSVRGLKKHFPIRGGILAREIDRVHAVDGVSFDIAPGETLGLVGESGCGKSTLGRCILRLIEPSAGEVWFQGQDVTKMEGEALRALRRDMQIIFQDPFASLNPRHTVGGIIGEALIIHALVKGRRAMEERVVQLLETVGLQPEHMRRFPHEFSGGQRQRIGIARALALEPEFIVADEAVSALDVSVQAQVINLMRQLQQDLKLTYLFISHNLAVVRNISDRVAVMYLGRIVEVAAAADLFARPLHPYTRTLLAALPSDHPSQRRTRVAILGDMPNPNAVGAGCKFASRCPHVQPRCQTDDPALTVPQPGHQVACLRVADGSLPG